MKIGNNDYVNLAVVDNQNNLLCVISDNQVICVDKLQIIGEDVPGKLCFIPMENSATKCFIRQEGASLPVGTMNATEFFNSQSIPDAVPELTEETKQENINKETELKEKEKKEEDDITVIRKDGSVYSGKEFAEHTKKQEERKSRQLPSQKYDARLIDNQSINLNNLGNLGALANLAANLPPETLQAILSALAGSKVTPESQEQKDDAPQMSETAQSIRDFEKQIAEERKI